MDAALKASVIPALRQLGFKGSLPHLRRLRGNAADLLSVQFHSAGGGFVVELGRVSTQGLDFHGRAIPLAKLNVSYLQHRHRLGAPFSGGDHWFWFGKADSAEAVTTTVIELLHDPALWPHIDSFPLPPHPA
jgi:hypothetical protein